MGTHEHEPELQAQLIDSKTGLRAFVVADNLVSGKAMGGTRISAGVSLEEVRGLARRMSLKLALAGVRIGGSKGAIVLDPKVQGEARERVLASFGQLAGPLLRGGVYLGTDLGCTYAERSFIHRHAQYAVEQQVSLPCDWATLWQHCSDVTGLGVAHASAVAADLLELGARRRRVVIQGFGEVGQAAARHAERLGLRVVAVADIHGTVSAEGGLPLDALLAITDERGEIDRTRLPSGVRASPQPEAWLDIDAEVLVPAAVANAVHAGNVQRVRAQIVVEGANSPLTPEAIAHLAGERRLVVPDIVANAGGAIGCGLALLGAIPTGTTPQEAAAWLFDQTETRVGANTRVVYEQARAEKLSTHRVAEHLAERRRSELFARS
ncbi:Glu/Leu/Phe/Val family dehydrogenase [Hyalangium sp.]|uniref:Glu/Leu/Phe/Val family dehydrogenase n=1 Tax=Hyalangium sp. TaxID=2028555 RepID=UPI002D381FA8|nr:Glu/Leu/Phe/Val dehydrogenase dimerization domain-containing protein [Hyalangium sp.]HYH94461.1 Glu/Leu/Phe/Val dehydrogenase dimerization domain-containing protein [Hyalangium sp.]